MSRSLAKLRRMSHHYFPTARVDIMRMICEPYFVERVPASRDQTRTKHKPDYGFDVVTVRVGYLWMPFLASPRQLSRYQTPY